MFSNNIGKGQQFRDKKYTLYRHVYNGRTKMVRPFVFYQNDEWRIRMDWTSMPSPPAYPCVEHSVGKYDRKTFYDYQLVVCHM